MILKKLGTRFRKAGNRRIKKKSARAEAPGEGKKKVSERSEKSGSLGR